MKNKNIVIILHLLIIIPAYTSPFWLDWRLILAGVFLYYLQIWLGSKFGLKLKMESVKHFLNILPLVITSIAVVYQVLFKGSILLSLKL